MNLGLINCCVSDFNILKSCVSWGCVELQDVENELAVQVSMKHEIELAMKLLEKDIHEKQDTLIGLRQQLEEVKAINIETYQKLQVRSILKILEFLVIWIKNEYFYEGFDFEEMNSL